MCNFLSLVVTKSDIFWSTESDSHEDIIKQYNLVGDIAISNFVKVEIIPPKFWDGTNLGGWVFQTNQDSLPDWYNEREVNLIVRAKLPEILKKITAKDGQVIESGRWLVVGNSKIIQSGGKCFASFYTTVTQSGGECWAEGHTQVTQSGGKCKAFDKAQVSQTDGECETFFGAKLIKISF